MACPSVMTSANCRHMFRMWVLINALALSLLFRSLQHHCPRIMQKPTAEAVPEIPGR